MTEARCRCQHKVYKHEYGVGRCVCGCAWFGSVEEFNRRAIEQAEKARHAQSRDCMCPTPNSDCQHPTCPRFPQPGHYEAMVVAVRDMAKEALEDGGMLNPRAILSVLSVEQV